MRFATRCTHFVCIHTHTLYKCCDRLMYIGGRETPATPNREIGFGFVSCSCRACVRAKLCGYVRQVSPTLGARTERLPAPSALVLSFHLLMLYAWVLSFIVASLGEMFAMCVGFLIVFEGSLLYASVLMYRCFSGRSLCYMRGFFDRLCIACQC